MDLSIPITAFYLTCAMCGGMLEGSTTEYLKKQGNFIAVIENIPCERCAQCGETYFSNPVMKEPEKIPVGLQIISNSLTVTVIDYADKAA